MNPVSMDEGEIGGHGDNARNDGYFQIGQNSCGPSSIIMVLAEEDPVFARQVSAHGFGTEKHIEESAKLEQDMLVKKNPVKMREAIGNYEKILQALQAMSKEIPGSQVEALASYLKYGNISSPNPQAQKALQALRSKHDGWPSEKKIKLIKRFPMSEGMGSLGASGAMINVLNERASPLSGTFYTSLHVPNEDSHQWKDKSTKIKERMIEKGVIIPWSKVQDPLLAGEVVTLGVAGGSSHWVSIVDIKRGKDGYEYLVHDPWTGISHWVDHDELKTGDFLVSEFGLAKGTKIDIFIVPSDKRETHQVNT